MHKWLLTLFLIGLGIPSSINAQNIKHTEHNISANFFQIKEKLNYGIIFRGPGLGYSYSMFWDRKKYTIDYTARFAFDYLESRKISAGNINLVPLKLSFLFKTNEAIKIGPQILADYNYQLYPDLQSAYSFWFTHVSIGAASTLNFSMKERLFQIRLETTLLGLTSRTTKYTDPYFFEFGVGDAFRFVNKDFSLKTLINYTCSGFEVRLKPNKNKRVGFAYAFQYYGYFNQPRISFLNQMIKIIFIPQKSK